MTGASAAVATMGAKASATTSNMSPSRRTIFIGFRLRLAMLRSRTALPATSFADGRPWTASPAAGVPPDTSYLVREPLPDYPLARYRPPAPENTDGATTAHRQPGPG